MKRLTAIALAALLLGACKNGTLAEDESGVPALATALSEAGRAEIQARVSAALNGAPVTIGRDAFRETHVLLIERQSHRDPQGNRLPGRSYETPERFELLRKEDRCYLLHPASDERWPLDEVECLAGC